MEIYDENECYMSDNRIKVRMGGSIFEKADGYWHFLVNFSNLFLNISMDGDNGFLIRKEGTRIIIPFVNSKAKGEMKIGNFSTLVEGISYLEFITTPEPNPLWVWCYSQDGKSSIMAVNAMSGEKSETWIVVYDKKFYFYNAGEVSMVNNTLRIKTGDINLIGKALNDFMMELKGYVFGRKFEGLGFYEFTYQ